MLLKKLVTLSVMMRDMEDLTGGLQTFFLIHNTVSQRNSTATAAERYSTVVGGGASPSLANTDVLLAQYGVSLPSTFLQSQSQLTRNQVIYACMFGENAIIVAKLEDFVARRQEEEQMLLDYVP